jgi:hypothetical protein
MILPIGIHMRFKQRLWLLPVCELCFSGYSNGRFNFIHVLIGYFVLGRTPPPLSAFGGLALSLGNDINHKTTRLQSSYG